MPPARRRPSVARHPDDLTASLRNYLECCGAERGLAQSTVGNYSRDLRRFVDFLRRRGVPSVKAVPRLVLREWLSELHKSGLASATARRVVSEARAFLLAAAPGEPDSFEGLSLPRLERAASVPLNTEEVRALLAAPPPTVLGRRDRAIIAALYSSGLRVSQLVALDVRQLDLDEGVVRRWDRGGRLHPAFLGLSTVAALRDYLENSRPDLARHPEEPSLFLSRRGQRISTRAVDLLVAKYARVVGVTASPQALRRACALHMRAGGASAGAVRQLLGTRLVGTRQPAVT
ncbi:MAG: tyrosine-type recombinase/integrase [Chloroflexota bacterium]